MGIQSAHSTGRRWQTGRTHEQSRSAAFTVALQRHLLVLYPTPVHFVIHLAHYPMCTRYHSINLAQRQVRWMTYMKPCSLSEERQKIQVLRCTVAQVRWLVDLVELLTKRGSKRDPPERSLGRLHYRNPFSSTQNFCADKLLEITV